MFHWCSIYIYDYVDSLVLDTGTAVTYCHAVAWLTLARVAVIVSHVCQLIAT